MAKRRTGTEFTTLTGVINRAHGLHLSVNAGNGRKFPPSYRGHAADLIQHHEVEVRYPTVTIQAAQHLGPRLASQAGSYAPGGKPMRVLSVRKPTWLTCIAGPPDSSITNTCWGRRSRAKSGTLERTKAICPAGPQRGSPSTSNGVFVSRKRSVPSTLMVKRSKTSPPSLDRKRSH